MATPIEEFFVGLGFKIDSHGMSAFTGGVFKATTMTQKLGFAAIQAAIEVEKMTVKVARQFEKLYYAAEIANTSVASLQAWEYAAQQIGLSSAEAEGMVKGLGTAMRTNPGIEALMTGLGVRTRTNNGELRNTTELMHDLVGQLMKMPFYQGAAYAAIFGISPDELKLMEDHYGEAEKAAADFAAKQRAAGVDADALATKSRLFDNDLRALGGSLEIAGEKIAIWFMPSLDGMATGLMHVIDQLTGAEKVTNSWIESLEELGRVPGFAFLVHMAHLEAKGWDEIFDDGTGNAGTAFDNYAGLLSSSKGDSKTTSSLMRAIMGMGYTQEAAAGIAANLMDESGGNPAVVNGSHYGIAQWDTNRQADFAAKYGHDIHGSSLQEQLAFLNYELTEGKYKDVGDKIRGGGPEGTAYGSGYLMSTGYEKPAGGLLASMVGDTRGMQSLDAFKSYNLGAAGAGGGVALNQKVDIHINGGPSPEATGSAVANLQDSMFSRMVRQLSSAVQ